MIQPRAVRLTGGEMGDADRYEEVLVGVGFRLEQPEGIELQRDESGTYGVLRRSHGAPRPARRSALGQRRRPSRGGRSGYSECIARTGRGAGQ